MKTLDLCLPCAAKLGVAYTLRKVAGGVDNKITCAECGWRYGAAYEVAKKERNTNA